MRRHAGLFRAAAFVAVLFAATVPAGAETPEELFERGNAAYENDRFEEAARAYEMVLQYRIVDARVEYNLGNAYYKLGDLGRAVLHYERAFRLRPTDEDIQANLALARSQRFDRVEVPEAGGVLRRVRALQDRIGPDRHAMVFLALVWVVGALATWAAARPGRWRPALGWALAGTLVLGVAIGISWYVTYERLEGTRLAVVLDATVEVLAGPGDNNASLFTIHEGLAVEVRSERAEWVQVSLPNGLNGWVPRRAVGFV